MDKSSISFDWEYELIPGLGKIFRPYVPIKLNTTEGWKPFDFLVDSGADTTMLPFGMLEILGIDKKNTRKDRAIGIGGHTISTWKTTIPIRIGDWDYQVRVAFASDNLTPLLLGRIDTLDNEFSWIFDHKKKKIIFKK
jgi:hypothetical protein